MDSRKQKGKLLLTAQFTFSGNAPLDDNAARALNWFAEPAAALARCGSEVVDAAQGSG
jgi:hypothetical protein